MGGVPQVWEFLPPLLFDYEGQSIEDACQKNAYLDYSLVKNTTEPEEDTHTINIEDCEISELGNGLKAAVFKGTYADNYDLDTDTYEFKIIPLEQRRFSRFKGAIIQLKSQKYPGLKIWGDERFINFEEQEKDFDKIVNSISFI